MEIERKIKLTLTDDELDILDKAANILNNICNAYDDIQCCDECPLQDMCDITDPWDVYTPHNHLFELIDKLKKDK